MSGFRMAKIEHPWTAPIRVEEIPDTGRRIELTAAGMRLAERVVRRHRLAERLLTDVLGLSWADAHKEAGKWEHIISDQVEEAIVRVLDNPTTCPHGNPIPGSDYAAPAAVALSDLEVGTGRAIVQRNGTVDPFEAPDQR